MPSSVRDREKLIEARDQALADPIAFVKRLQAGEQLDLPGKQKIAELPDIKWEKYRVVAADEVVREELLVQFPSEDVEMERWKKIATALGNRTPIQVQSRTQKYFLKLQKAGMPVPGRVGKASKR